MIVFNTKVSKKVKYMFPQTTGRAIFPHFSAYMYLLTEHVNQVNQATGRK